VGVTLLSIAITLSGMAIIANRQILWYVSIVFGTLGCGFVAWGLFRFL
jgi:succinate dehydrogenase/fumarate reductase cytochrome b subunit